MNHQEQMAEPRPVYTIDHALSTMGFGKFQCLVLAYAGLGWVAEAMEVMILSFIGPAVKYEWSLSSSEESLITTVVFGGMLVGAYSWGLVSDNFGRRQIIMPRLNWRWLLALSSVPSFMALLFYFPTLESPRYLCMKGRTTDAHEILEKIARLNQKSLPSGTLVSDQSIELDEEFAPSEDTHLLCSKENKTKVLIAGFSSVLTLLSSQLIRTTLSLWLLFFGNAFSYYGIILLTSELSSEQSKCQSISLHSENFQDASLYVDVFITSLAELPGLVLSAIIVDRIGRKLSMAIMFMLGCIFLLPLAFHQKEVLTTGLLFGARMCLMGTITVANIYAPEIYPTSIRATGYGVASAVGRIGGMICPLVAVGLVSGCHQTAAILLFEAVMVVSGLSVMLLPLETKGRGLTDVVTVTVIASD
ncbi:organic cation/carnitine transporter 7-like isoform X3 [Camellia sinensis]|uniref:organic cation/carnitine transporter 7-like isoform X3 n=1 Tax=Camellia sinensis TaxID=4442 RepID=UPI00103646C1|nr:organic cation/carnitine transporter 7-like isoform X3 [Camellia sinensis]